MDWQVFEHGGRVLAWNRASGETQVGAPLLWGGESIEEGEGERAGQQFKFAARENGEEQSALSAAMTRLPEGGAWHGPYAVINISCTHQQ